MKNLHALLIGIDRYAHIRDLGGCRRDIEQVQDYLHRIASPSGFAFHPLPLLDQDATRQGIIAAFGQLTAAVQKGDVALVYFSGHGAQEAAGEHLAEAEYDGKLEGWVCHDTGVEPGQAPLLVDKELRYLLAQLSARKADVIFISDSCHSGDNHRSAQLDDDPADSPEIRRAVLAAEGRTGLTLPARAYEQFLFASAIPASRLRHEPLDQVLPQGRLVAMSACDSWEFAYEKSGMGGVFTHYLLQTLRATQGSISYYDLQSRVRALIKRELPQVSQVPRAAAVEGFEDDLFREFLSGAVKQRPIVANLTNLRHTTHEDPDRAESLWTMDKGQIHGVQPSRSGEQESLVAISLPGGHMAYGYITAVSTAHSEVSVSPREAGFAQVDPQESYYGYLSGLMSQALYLHVQGEAEGVAALLQAAQKQQQELRKHQLYFREQAVGCPYAIHAVTVDDRSYWTISQPGDDRPLVKQVRGWSESSFASLLGQLRQAQRWQFILNLTNAASDALSPDDVEVVLYQQGQPVQTEGGVAHLAYDRGSAEEPAGKVKIQLVNHGAQALYVGLLYLDTNFTANPTLLEPTVVKLVPGQEMWALGGREITLRLDPYIRQFDWPASVFYLQALFSTTPITVDEFAQKGLERPTLPWPDHRGTSRGLDWGQKEAENLPRGTWQTRRLELRAVNPWHGA